MLQDCSSIAQHSSAAFSMDVKDPAAVLSTSQSLNNETQQHPLLQSNESVSSTSHATRALKDVSFGAIAGIAGKYVEYPFDTVKVRLQSQNPASAVLYSGPLDCFQKSIQRDGFRSLYRGISTPLLGAAVENGSVFFSYRLTQAVFRATTHPEPEQLPFTVLLVCGAVSGAFTSLVLTPIELIKCKIQVPSTSDASTLQKPRGAFNLIATIFQQEGLRGFWRGQVGTLIREMGGSAAWFGSYEGVSGIFRGMESNKNLDIKSPLPVHQQLLAGASAGMTYNFVFFPADTVKSVIQTEDVNLAGRAIKKESFLAVGKSIWKSQGVKGLYRGCGITVARSAPSSAFIFTIYETLKNKFDD